MAAQKSAAKRGSAAAMRALVAIQPEGVPVSKPSSGSMTTAYMASRSRLRAMASVSWTSPPHPGSWSASRSMTSGESR